MGGGCDGTKSKSSKQLHLFLLVTTFNSNRMPIFFDAKFSTPLDDGWRQQTCSTRDDTNPHLFPIIIDPFGLSKVITTWHAASLLLCAGLSSVISTISLGDEGNYLTNIENLSSDILNTFRVEIIEKQSRRFKFGTIRSTWIEMIILFVSLSFV